MAKKAKATKKRQRTGAAAFFAKLWLAVWNPMRARVSGLLKRRPHRSFRLTRRRDYKRSLELPGYWSFTNQVRRTLWQNKKLFGGVILTYAIITIVVSGLGAQENYSNLADTLKDSGGELLKGNLGAVAGAVLLIVPTATSSFSPDIAQAETAAQGVQVVLAGLSAFFAWLTVIWLLRNVLAGHNPKLRDGLYNSGSPVIALIVVGFIITLQLLPVAVAVLVYTAAQQSGLLEVGVSAMLVWSGVVLFGLLSLYWIASSFIASVVVTLPGMYPMQAIRAAGDLVTGRRLRMLFRLVWLIFILALAWALIVIPIVLFDSWIKQLVPAIEWLPLVPLAIIAMGCTTLVFAASYVYLLYRRIVDDGATPA